MHPENVALNIHCNDYLWSGNQGRENSQKVTQTLTDSLRVYQSGNENILSSIEEIIRRLTPSHLHIPMQAKSAIFRMVGTISEARTYLNRNKIDILFRQYSELLILKDNMKMRSHFDKKFETCWTLSSMNC